MVGFLLFLFVHSFAPTSKPGQKTVYGAARQEAVRVSCELEADPAQDVAFPCHFNASLQMLGSTNVLSEGVRSWATVVPQTDEDYGVLVCGGKNGIGIQREPCVFVLVEADGSAECCVPAENINTTLT
ncbi:hypothetical protein HPB48_001644 [Haemaphysalis longicornis]|uniref:Uncharacterized protein n=1 Tax=Haemaphysalis longicornis TaxID=44386 RepID=A0A9J6FYL4_HAELO|nr:hypothetical protein HPB48_001644 [Haemaphysalis longicornis]